MSPFMSSLVEIKILWLSIVYEMINVSLNDDLL